MKTVWGLAIDRLVYMQALRWGVISASLFAKQLRSGRTSVQVFCRALLILEFFAPALRAKPLRCPKYA